MDHYHIFAPIWQTMVMPLNGVIQSVVASLMAYVGPVFQVGVPAYLIIMLMIAAWGSDETAFNRFFKDLWLSVVIFTLATNADSFNYYVWGLITGVEGEIVNAIAGNLTHGATIGADAFDMIFSRLYNTGVAVQKTASLVSPKTWSTIIIVAGYWVLVSLCVGAMFVEYLATYCVQLFLIAFGPLFIACYFFPFTRGYFDRWLSSVMKTVLMQIFVVGTLAIFLNVITKVVTGIAVWPGAPGAAPIDPNAAEGSVLVLLGAWIICLSFTGLTAFLAYEAAHIAGAVHAAVRGPMRLVPDRPHPPAPAPAPAPPPAQLPAPAPALRDYPFQRHVGSAP